MASIRKFLLLTLFLPIIASAQIEEGWPHQLTQEEIERALENPVSISEDRGITTPPVFSNKRTMAEWEEVQAIVVSWMGYNSILKKIVAASKLECEVIILTENVATTTAYLTANNTGGPPLTLDNITLIQVNLDSVWERDFGANTVYGDEVDDLYLVDWIYNRPRFADDVTPDVIGANLGIPVYSTTAAPNNLMNTGGNFMSDGFGTAFASELVLDENQGGSAGWTTYPNHTEAEIDGIMNNFMGIDTYIKMPVLPFDGIHHIDMHMKLLDEETIIVSKYPTGVADGPQIESNINYVLNNFTTKWGTPFKIIEVPAPPQQSTGTYPNAGGDYLTYANAVFVNKTVLLPTYYTQYDTTAIRIYQEALPGYNIVGIDCDNAAANIIAAGGAIHCITHTVGVEDPLLISYPCIEDSNNPLATHTLQAYINHRTGINSASLFYKTSLLGSYIELPMVNVGGNNWEASIPAQPFGTTVYYYVEAEAVSGKVQRRPIVAPQGYKTFKVINEVFGCTNPLACNYDEAATIDNGTCILPDGCTDPLACNFNPAALCDDGTCQSGADYSLYITTDCWGEETSWNITDELGNVLYSQSSNTLGDQTTYQWDVCLNSGCYNFNIFDVYGDGIGGSQWGSCGVDGNYYMTDVYGNILVDMNLADFGPSETHAFCVPIVVPGCIDASACNYNIDATTDDGSCTYPGCMDIAACNYSASAACSDGSCEYISCLGCMDPSACNYDFAATVSDGTCTYPGCTDILACNYSSLAGCDSGTCEYISCVGCTDPDACNYNSSATIDDGSCEFTTCACPGDLNADNVVNTTDLLLFLTYLGCTDFCDGDLNQDGFANTVDLLLFLGYYGNVCE
jgi:agmatine deiminase